MTYWVEAQGDPDPPDKLPYDFKLYDDDGELYFEGRCNEGGIELAFDWEAIDAGCTRIHTRLPGCVWTGSVWTETIFF